MRSATLPEQRCGRMLQAEGVVLKRISILFLGALTFQANTLTSAGKFS